jgi:hypothetical protein
LAIAVLSKIFKLIYPIKIRPDWGGSKREMRQGSGIGDYGSTTLTIGGLVKDKNKKRGLAKTGEKEL